MSGIPLQAPGLHLTPPPPSKAEVREKFDEFVGETFFSHLLSQMRKTTDKPEYLHGGRAEEVFQGQLDQLLVTEMTAASRGQFSGPMFELSNLPKGA